MKNLKKTLSLLMAILMMVGLLAACGDNSGDNDKDTTPVDPTARYEETVTLTSYFEIAAPIQNSFDESQLTEYKYYKDLLAEENIEVDWLWCAADTEEDAETKKNNAIATGDIPDFMVVSATQLALLAKSELINKDLNSLWDTYASETLKKVTTAEGDAAMGAASQNGKLIAIPMVDSSIDASSFLWIRKDWLDNLGLEVPTTLEDLYDVMEAFKNDDPDKDGVDDTVGIALHKSFLSTGTGDCEGLFNGFGSYPLQWVEDGNGGLQYGAITEESKAALEYMAKMYKDGLIQEDFSVKDDAGTTELTSSSTAGIQYGAMWNAMWPLSMTLGNDPNADWIACAIPGVDGIGAPGISPRIIGFVVINSECEHPEAVIKMMNFWCEKYFEVGVEEHQSYFVEYEESIPQFPQHHVMLKTWNPTKNLDQYYAVKEAIATGDTSKLNAEATGTYNDVMGYLNGDPAMYGPGKTFAPEGSAFEAMANYYESDSFFMNKFTGAQTPAMSKNISVVQDKIYEYYTKVIMGVETTDSWDDFVADLNALGLEEITKEVNDWYASK